ncbi:MAG: hypothetical protein IKW74_00970, partial [Thermoguttaceae bacterium]|nr:hypothetical protein [Thermoguttaceae bacterium]
GHNPEADTENGHSGKIRFHRVAVGDHLILGGDNFDLALAHYLESKLVQGGKFQVTDGKLAPRQWAALLRQSCQLKELFLSDSAPEIQTVSLPATGSRLIGGSKTFTVSRDEVRQVVLDGFFPKVPLESRPNRRRLGIREIGLPYASDPAISRHLARFLTVHRDAGLAAGHSVAEKLNSSVPDSESTTGETGGTVGGTAGATGTPNTVGSAVPEASPLQSSRPDLILFNGGVFASPEIQKRVLDLFVDWFHCPPPVVLQNTDLHLAVSWGAAYYGMVRRGLGERISASLARTYYVGVTDLRNSEAERKTSKISMDLPENPFNDSDSEGTVISDNDDFGGGINSETSEDSGLKMLCLIPARLEPDEEVVLADRTFSLTVDRPVSFPIFVSSTRLTDEPGEIVRLNPEETIPLPPIQTVLRTRNRAGQESGVVVELCGRLSQLGTIEMFLRKVRQEGDRGRLPSWKLQFDVRAATETDREKERTTGEKEGILDETLIESVQQTLRQVFVDTENSLKPSQLMRQLSAVTELPKNLFPTVLLRRISEMLLDMESGRKRSESHESRWLNLLGFALRPGFGVAMDDWRVDRVWKRNIGNLTYRTPGNRLQLWILWRRIAAGLSEGQQQMIIEPLLSNVRDLHRQLTENRGRGADLDLASQEGIEIWRLIGSLELIAPEVKEELGNLILDIVDKKRMKPATSAMFWTLGRLGSRVPFHAPINQVPDRNIAENWADHLIREHRTAPNELFALMLLTRRTDDRVLDVSDQTRQRVIGFMQRFGASEHWIELVRQKTELIGQEEQTVFGDSLPLGLSLIDT